ncbi:MAG: type II secretion system secretin GspD [Kiritimatiellia bacterium]
MHWTKPTNVIKKLQTCSIHHPAIALLLSMTIVSGARAQPSDAVPSLPRPVAGPSVPAVPAPNRPTPRTAIPTGALPSGTNPLGNDVPAGGQREQAEGIPNQPERLKFRNAPLDMLLEAYARKTGRTLLLAPNLPKPNITLQSQKELTPEQFLQAIDTVLNMHGIAILKVGNDFLKVVPNQTARKEAIETQIQHPSEPLPEIGTLVSQVVSPKYLEISEVQKIIDAFRHPYAQVDVLERVNSILITDTAENINRIVQILSLLDQPILPREEPHILYVKFTKASEIKKKLEEIIADAEREAQKSTVPRPRPSGEPGVVTTPPTTIPGVIRAPLPPRTTPSETEQLSELIAQAERGIIRGKVKIVADDRTNVLIFITRPENMKFFERIVQVLDVETAPDVIVEVIRLEFAEAKTVAAMLNDLIGAVSKTEAPPTAPTAGAPGTTPTGAEAVSRTLREIAESVRERRQSTAEGERKSKVGELSKENIKILCDERTNALIIMASKADMETLKETIQKMDKMLSQVLIESVVLEVSLDNSIESGVDWLQRSLVAYNKAPDGNRRVNLGFAGMAGGGAQMPRDVLSFTTPDKFPTTDKKLPLPGLTYYLTFFDLNIDVVLRLAAADSRTRILNSPVILTTDNKKAEINVATERYFYKGKKYVGEAQGNPIYEDDVERKQVGITLSVTPRINEKKFVVMEISQEIQNVSGVQTINATDWPLVTTRKFTADVSVQSGETIVLGGLVLTRDERSSSKVPLVGDIPLLGRLFSSKSKKNERSEVVVFITPYVLDTPDEIAAESRRRHRALEVQGMWKRGWSASPLAEPSRGFSAEPSPSVPQKSTREARPLDPATRAFVEQEEQRLIESFNRLDQRVEGTFKKNANP